MCGRTALRLAPDEVRHRTGVVQWVDESHYRPSANVAPTYFQPIILADTAQSAVSPASKKIPKPQVEAAAPEAIVGPGEVQKYHLHSMKWGLILTTSEKMKIHPINARDDSVMNPSPKPMFARLRDHNRCVALAQGFYEWKRGPGNKKTPYYVRHKKGELLYLAGLYACAGKGTDEPIYSYTILTTNNTPALAFLHDRMPVILDKVLARAWLSDTPWTNDLQKTAIRAWDDDLEWYPVDPRVNKTGEDDPKFMEPYKSMSPDLTTLWGKKHKTEAGDGTEEEKSKRLKADNVEEKVKIHVEAGLTSPRKARSRSREKGLQSE